MLSDLPVLKHLRRYIHDQDVMYWRARLLPAENARKINEVAHSEKSVFSLRTQIAANCIFVHVTKSGGTAVAQALFGEQPHHYRAIQYRAMYGIRRYNAMFKFAFVRNPWDRLYSAWSYLSGGGWSHFDHRWYIENIARYEDFNTFIRQWLTEDSISEHIHFWPQSWFLCDKHGRVIVDYVGRFENLADDYEVVSRRLGIGSPLKQLNTSSRKANYTEIYEPDTIDLVTRVYQQDIDLFGYRFDS